MRVRAMYRPCIRTHAHDMHMPCTHMPCHAHDMQLPTPTTCTCHARVSMHDVYARTSMRD